MVTTKARPRKTVKDFMSLPEGTRAELIQGELLMSPSPRPLHQQIVCNLHLALAECVRRHSLGVVFVAPLDVHLPSGDVVEPDLLFIEKSNRGIIQDWIRGVPDLLIEVVSPEGTDRDRIVKRDLYARNGVKEYWIVDTQERNVEVLSLRQREFVAGGYFQGGDTIVSPMLSALALPVEQVFA